MKGICFISIFSVLFFAACTGATAPPTQIPVLEPSQISTLSPRLTDTPTSLPSATIAPRPTIDLKLVLTPSITVEYEVDYVGLKTSDDVFILAKIYGTGEPAVILAHQGTFGANQRDWEPFARLIAQRGYTAASLDFRGRGLSKGNYTDTQFLNRDMQALVKYLQSAGYAHIACMGASMGGTSCLRAAVDNNFDGVVVIGSTLSIGDPTRTTEQELAALTIPKLFITTEKDRYDQIPGAIKNMYELSQEPKMLQVFPGEAHGTEMFKQPYGEEFTALLMAFVESLR